MAVDSSDIPSRCAALLKAARVPPVGNLWGLSIDWGHPASGTTVLAQKDIIKINPDTFSFFDETMAQETHSTLEDNGGTIPAPRFNSNLIKQAPSTVPDIYPFNRFLVSAILCNTTQIPGVITLKGKIPSGEEINMTFQVQTAESPALLHALAARRLISDLQDGNIASLSVSDQIGKVSSQELIKAEVVKLCEEYQIASEFAAFVAVEERPRQREKAPRSLGVQQTHGEELASERYNVSFFGMHDGAPSEYDDCSIKTDDNWDMSSDTRTQDIPADSGIARIKIFQAAKRLWRSNPKHEASS